MSCIIPNFFGYFYSRKTYKTKSNQTEIYEKKKTSNKLRLGLLKKKRKRGLHAESLLNMKNLYQHQW